MNEGRLIFSEMKIDKTPFPVHTNTHTIDLSNAKVLIRPEQAEGAEGKNVVIGEARPNVTSRKIYQINHSLNYFQNYFHR